VSSVDHYKAAEAALDTADQIANSDLTAWDHGPGRHVHVANALARAQVHATLAHADAVTEASNAGVKAIYDGRI
jgi:hypothetical protein